MFKTGVNKISCELSAMPNLQITLLIIIYVKTIIKKQKKVKK